MLLPLIIAVYYRLNGFPEASYISYILPIVILLFIGIVFTLKKPKRLKNLRILIYMLRRALLSAV